MKILENSNEISIANFSKNFLENTGLQVDTFLKNNNYGEVVNISDEMDIINGKYTSNITLKIIVVNTKNIDAIIPNLSRILEAEFIRMEAKNIWGIPNYMPHSDDHNCYLFIYEKYL